MTRKLKWMTIAVLIAATLSGVRADEKPTAPVSKKALQTRTYAVADVVVPVRDFVGDDENLHTPPTTTERHLIETIENFVAPTSWSSQGGVGTINYVPGSMSLEVSTTPAVQAKVGEFLTVLRKFQPRQFSLQVTVGTGCEGPSNCQMLPKVTVFEGQRAKLEAIQVEAVVEDRDGVSSKPVQKKTGFTMEGSVLTIDEGRIGINLDVQRGNLDKSGEHVRVVREAKPGEPFKVKLGEPAKGKPQDWLEVVVRQIPEEAEVIATNNVAPNPFPVAFVDGGSVLLGGLKSASAPQAEERLQPVPTPRLVPIAKEIQLAGYVSDDGCLEEMPLYMPATLLQAKHEVNATEVAKVKKADAAKAVIIMRQENGTELKLRMVGKRVVLTTPSGEAWADHITFEKDPTDSILLEGNVRMKRKSDDGEAQIHAPRLRIRGDWLVDLNP